jgi:phosphoribosylaminoimidazole-succinocarboxamide synthase
MSNFLFKVLEREGVPTHFVEELSERETVVKMVKIVPLEVIIRNIAAGSFSKRYGVEEGRDLACTVIEYSYKNDDLGDPLINDYHALALELASREEMNRINELAFKVNEVLKKLFLEIGVILVDFKLEFGRLSDGTIVLADEISPDTCRLWDAKTRAKLDKDRFRRDMGNVEEAYQEIFGRLGING